MWRDDGTDRAIHDLLRCQAREKAGRAEDPTAVVLDTQSIRAANQVVKRWVIEQTHGTLMLHRRLVRDYEILPASTVSHTLWSSTANLTRRLTGTTTPTWRTTTRDVT